MLHRFGQSTAFSTVLMWMLAVSVSIEARAQGPSDAAFVSVPEDIQIKYNARCLDGSTPGIYLRKGDPVRFKFHIQGGGWCFSPGDCAGRAQSILGSNATWTPWLSAFWPPEGAGFYGLEDANASNPFGAYTFVWLTYCDGSSFTSDATGPMVVGNATIWNRGRANLDAYLELLDRETGFLSNAVDVIVSGTSAGGLATYLHSGYIKSRLLHVPNRLVAVPDAGFFLDAYSYSHPGQHAIYSSFAGAMGSSLWNSSLQGGAAACVAAQVPGEVARCFFPQYLYPFITDVDGVFILQSKYDTANLGICYQLSCDLATGGCTPAETAAIATYALDIQNNITAVQATFGNRDGYFITSCWQHEESCRARDWYGISINGQSANNTLYSYWMLGGGQPGATRIDGPWPSDSSCAPQGFVHGAC